MMNYETFKTVISTRIKEFLPPIFQSYKVKTTVVRKINEEKDTLLIMPQDKQNVIAMPNIYLDDMYEEFRQYQDIDEILKVIAAMVLQYTGSFPPEDIKLSLKERKDAIVMNVINTKRNPKLLAQVPHKEIMDLSIIYRIIMHQTENGIMTALVDNQLLEELELTQEELEQLAYQNTSRMFPIEISKMSDFLYVMTNSQKIHGATTLIYENSLEKMAQAIGSDFFVIPSSIHEVLAVPEKEIEANDLVPLLEEGNRVSVEANEVLSDNIYYYDRLKKEINIAV